MNRRYRFKDAVLEGAHRKSMFESSSLPLRQCVDVKHPGAEYEHIAQKSITNPSQYECAHGWRFEKELFK